jgi:hypothetical protein
LIVVSWHPSSVYFRHPPKWVEFNRYSWFNDTDVERVYIKDRSQCDGDVVYHPYYNDTEFDNDVALIFLPNPVTDFTPVQLNEDKNVPKDGNKVNVAGWGLWNVDFPIFNYWGPEEVTYDYVPNEACSKKPYRWPEEYILDSTICAVDYEEEKSVCWYDIGELYYEFNTLFCCCSVQLSIFCLNL